MARNLFSLSCNLYLFLFLFLSLFLSLCLAVSLYLSLSLSLCLCFLRPSVSLSLSLSVSLSPSLSPSLSLSLVLPLFLALSLYFSFILSQNSLIFGLTLPVSSCFVHSLYFSFPFSLGFSFYSFYFQGVILPSLFFLLLSSPLTRSSASCDFFRTHHSATRGNTLRHSSAHCDTLQHTGLFLFQCSTLHLTSRIAAHSSLSVLAASNAVHCMVCIVCIYAHAQLAC